MKATHLMNAKILMNKKRDMRGFTLVELMIVVAIIGVLAALAIYGVTRYMAYSKTSEAKNSIGAISRAATAAFERQNAPSQLLAPGASGTGSANSLCGAATNTVPLAVTAVAGVKYQPNPADGQDYNTGDATTGWKCLGFAMTQPQLYMYAYRTTAPACAGAPSLTNGYAAEAQGDLDADTVLSCFGRYGEVDAGSGTLRSSTNVLIVNEYE